GAVDALELGEEGLGFSVLPLEIGQGRRGEPVVVLVPAHGGGEQRVLLQPDLPLALEQVVEPRRLVGREGRDGEREQGKKKEQLFHRDPPDEVTPGSLPRAAEERTAPRKAGA